MHLPIAMQMTNINFTQRITLCRVPICLIILIYRHGCNMHATQHLTQTRAHANYLRVPFWASATPSSNRA